MTVPLENYGLIGNGETAALVSRGGSIDWLCLPRFDSDACFAALIGTEENGFWSISPAVPSRATWRYQPDTLILETDFETESGAVRLTDFMAIHDGAPVLVRLVSGLRGCSRLTSRLRLKFDFGAVTPWIEHDGKTVKAHAGPDLVVFRSPVGIAQDVSMIAADFEVGEGEELVFLLEYASSLAKPSAPIDAKKALTKTQARWRDWIGRFDKTTQWPEAVRRSLITLRALVYGPSGGIVAAPTTSLPEAPAGAMNWDYRFCWVRDATFTILALLNAGYHKEAADWRQWLLRAVAGDPDRMRIAYRVDGGRRLEEWSVDWLSGYRWATPVRAGNAAAAQFQLDIYGELIDALDVAARAGMTRSVPQQRLEDAIVAHVAKVWRQPDHGLWESRGKPRHYVYSKVSAWVALDRHVASRAVSPEDEQKLRLLAELRDQMHEEICREGYDTKLRAFVEYYGSERVDASLLLLPQLGFLPVEDDRIASTIAAVERDLADDGLVRRNGDAQRDGAFLACSCWLADCQALQGRGAAARETFERVLAVRNELGLLSEEYDLKAGRLSGNFPQALSHLALIQTALRLSGPVLGRGNS
jgi:GH15 family glucan-1,4-alpha-glucosidase